MPANPPALPGAYSLGSLYEAIGGLKDQAVSLQSAYEAGDAVYDLADRAMNLRLVAQRIEGVLDAVASALSGLGE